MMQINKSFFYGFIVGFTIWGQAIALSDAQKELAQERGSLQADLAEAKVERDQDLNKCQPIHDAALANNTKTLETLLKQHANLDAIGCFWQMTPIQYIIFKNETNKNSSLATTVQWFLKNGARNLENKDNGFGRTALHLAAMYDQPETINVLCQHGANVKAQDDDGMTPLHLAAQYDRIAAAKALIRNKVPLTIQKRNPDAKTIEEDELSFPIHIAAYVGNIDMLDLFVNLYKQDINVPDNTGNTPLHYAAISLKTKPVKWLLDHGADVSIKDNTGKTALNQVAGILVSLYNKYKDEQTARSEKSAFQNFIQDSVSDAQKKITKQIVEGMNLEYPEELVIKSEDDVRNNEVVQLLIAAKKAKAN